MSERQEQRYERIDAQQAIRHGPSTAPLRVAVSGRSIATFKLQTLPLGQDERRKV
jgi:hypothetical protein